MSKKFKRVEARFHYEDDLDIINFIENKKDDNTTRLIKRALRHYMATEGAISGTPMHVPNIQPNTQNQSEAQNQTKTPNSYSEHTEIPKESIPVETTESNKKEEVQHINEVKSVKETSKKGNEITSKEDETNISKKQEDSSSNNIKENSEGMDSDFMNMILSGGKNL